MAGRWWKQTGAQLIVTNESGVLDGVTLVGDLPLDTTEPRVTVVNGLELNGTATLRPWEVGWSFRGRRRSAARARSCWATRGPTASVWSPAAAR